MLSWKLPISGEGFTNRHLALVYGLRLSHGVSVHYLFKIRGLAQSRGSYALEAERKMGQLLELAKKNTGAKGIGQICQPWFTLVYSGSTRKTVAVETDGTVHLGYFFPLAWSTAAFSSGSLTSDKVR